LRVLGVHNRTMASEKHGVWVWPGFIHFGIWSRNCSCEAGHSHSIHSYRIHLQWVLILFVAA